MILKPSQAATETRTLLHRLAQLWLRGLLATSGIAFAGVVSILLGLNAFNGHSPLIELIRQRPTTSLIIAGAALSITLGALLIGRVPPRIGSDHNGHQIAVSKLAAATLVATASTTFLIAVLLMVSLRPSWCPTVLCLPAQIVTNPNGIHDGNIEMYLTSYQSQFYVISGDVNSYTLGNLPRQDIGAARVDQAGSGMPLPYIAIGVHSLRSSGYNLLIDRVSVILTEIPPFPSSLNVWQSESSATYHGNPYQVTYRGETSGAVLPASYLSAPRGFVQLVPGESDQLDIRLSSQTPADLRFHVMLTYRFANGSTEYTLALPEVFEMAFSTKSNWHPYVLMNGRLAPVVQ